MKTKIQFIAFFITCFISITNSYAQEGFLGEIKIFAGNYAPRGWAFCEGQTFSIRDNMELFSVIGTIYGGDGRNTFQLPDLRGKVTIGVGYPPSSNQNYLIGQSGGQNTIQIPNNRTTIAKPTSTKNEEITTLSYPTEIDNRQPYLAIRYIICISGDYPSRE